ncbi:MAG: CYTH domain-containing protein [Lachnospiraceae bacterium]|nr:CYTH domain-containing protein [Lachnospiraceae bacterium]
MEIERKFLIKELPYTSSELQHFPHDVITQGYLCTSPVLRIRQKNQDYIFTYKSAGLMTREEIEAPLTKESFKQLLTKCDGSIIQKTRYKIPESQTGKSDKQLTIELDLFHGELEGLMLAEVEFRSEEEAVKYQAPEWFYLEVTHSNTFHNSTISHSPAEEILVKAKELLQTTHDNP